MIITHWIHRYLSIIYLIFCAYEYISCLVSSLVCNCHLSSFPANKKTWRQIRVALVRQWRIANAECVEQHINYLLRNLFELNEKLHRLNTTPRFYFYDLLRMNQQIIRLFRAYYMIIWLPNVNCTNITLLLVYFIVFINL